MKHVIDHNNPLARPELGHFLRSERAITDGKATAIEDMTMSGMKAMHSYKYLVSKAGSVAQVGHTKKDHINFVHRIKMECIEGGDANNVIEKLQDKAASQIDFFYRVRLDDDGRLSNVFWRDSVMLDDYGLYGHVMVFDTTNRTNKYNLICALFVGINSHWKNVMFGCAFLADEKTESFEWLFEVFRKSMGGKSPITIFTDQDLAIANAIEKVFPESRHRLCLWHLQQNAVGKFVGKKYDSEFKELFNKCLSGCVNEKAFQESWNIMIDKYDLGDHPWFKRLYGLKEKWCTTLSKDYFSAGIRSSQRSESTNHAISFGANKNTNLTDFYNIFSKMVENWRNDEKQDEFNCIRMIPNTKLKTGLARHALETYTLSMFKNFESKFYKSMAGKTLVTGGVESTVFYDVLIGDSTFQVIYDSQMKCVKCSCMKFEETGMLCCHCLRILYINSEQSIPTSYILKRWTKYAKSSVLKKGTDVNIEEERNTDEVRWKNDISRKYYSLILESASIENARELLDEGYNKFSKLVTEMKSENLQVSPESTSVKDPARSVTKL